MIQFKRRNMVWLAALTALTTLVLMSDVSVVIQAVFLMLFAAVALASVIDLNNRRSRELFQSFQNRSPLSRSRMSPQAREAVNRASARAGYYPSSVPMIDVGLIASQTGQDGLAMRRTRSISKDDDGVRPFITIHVPTQEAERSALLRYEIIDQSGKQQFIHEMKVYLRDGEMNILSDHHLPLMKNANIAGVGEWDLRVYIDGDLAGVHNFALTASYEERRRRLNTSGNEYYVTQAEEDDEEDIPLSLEDLLRNQGNERQESRR